HNITIQIIRLYSYKGLAMMKYFKKTEEDMLYKIQYAIKFIFFEPRLIKLASSEAILLEKVKFRSSVLKK
ncbi:6997_t:CDS:2, partial [Cetraspora pellucida]